MLTASQLRQDVYSILDQVLESGIPVEIQRKGRTLRIVSDQPVTRLAKLKKRDCVVGDPEDLVHMDWSTEWSENKAGRK